MWIHIDLVVFFFAGSKGWRSGESACLPPVWPGFKSRRRRHMWVEFVVVSLLCSERFFSGYSGFPLSSETSISKFQFDQESGRRRTTLWMCYLQIIIYLFIYLFIYFWLFCLTCKHEVCGKKVAHLNPYFIALQVFRATVRKNRPKS